MSITHRRTRRCKRRSKYSRKYKIKCKGGGGNKEFHFYNRFHYGDNILNLKFFLVNSNILKQNAIIIHYYYDSNYIKNTNELEKYIDSTIVKLHPLSDKPASAIELWMGKPIDNINYNEVDKFFSKFYKQILNYLGLTHSNIDTSLYQKEDYLLDIYNKLNPKFQDVDVLLLNNEPSSGQFDYNKQKLDALANKLVSKKLKVVVLRPVGDIPSTNTDGLSLQDIGAISTHAKYIVGVNTGALAPCYNIYTKNSVKKWIFFCKGGTKFDEINAVILPTQENINSANSYIQ